MKNKKYEELSQWVEKTKNGDQNAFKYLYDYTYKNIWFLASNYVNQKEEVEDIVQEVYMNVFHSIHHLKDTKAFISWINRIAYRCIMRSISKENLSIIDEYFSNYYIQSQNHQDPLQNIILEEKNKLLLDCIQMLPEKQKYTLIMNTYQELKYKEIASVLEVSVETVKKNLYLAKKNLKLIINQLPQEQKKDQMENDKNTK